MELWALSWSFWNIVSGATVFATSLTAWALVLIAATVQGLFLENSGNFDAVTHASILGWASLGNVVKLLKLVAVVASPRPARFVVDFGKFKLFNNFALIVFDFTSAFQPWNRVSLELVTPAIMSKAFRPVFISFTWLENLVANFTGTFFSVNTSFKIK